MKIYSDRKILLFCPSFYNYRDIIINELEDLGAKVISFDERPSNSIVFKILLRIKLYWLIEYVVNRYYNGIISKFDVVTDVFFINAEAVNKKNLKKMREKYDSASFTLYMWDSIKNKRNVLDIMSFFDKVYSFDPDDCRSESKLIFEPLFYNKCFEDNKTTLKYDISFVGSIHSDRLSIIKDLIGIENIKTKFFLYSPSKLFSILKIITQKKLKINDLKLISNQKIDFNEVSDMFFSSKAIVDIQHPNQIGLTMRTFEVLGSGRKLITTNKDISRYEFYNKNNILIIDRNNIDVEIVYEFINSECKISNDIVNHRIDNWLKRVLQ